MLPMSLQANKIFSNTKKTAARHSSLFLCIKTVILTILFSCLFLSSCSKNQKTLILWTDNPEFRLYTELFNTKQNDVKILTVYKDSPTESFPPPKDEPAPDLIAGKWLNAESLAKFYLPLDYLLSDSRISRKNFYKNILNAGEINGKQLLLPVNFNIPSIIFSSDNSYLLSDDYFLTPEQIKEVCTEKNRTNKNNSYTFMGFAPSWNPDFLYTLTKLKSADYGRKGNTFTWNEEAISSTTDFIKDWTKEINTSTLAENDYKFKYLYTPELKWITQGNSLFAYMNSNSLLKNPPEKLENIDFRWLKGNDGIPTEDGITFISMYRNSKKLSSAEKFITWFFSKENQKEMLEWKKSMNLVSNSFGIAGGFSALKEVNEKYFPIFYPALLGNLPPEEYITANEKLPERWENLKEKVILPYLKQAVNTEEQTGVQLNLTSLYTEWSKQVF